MQLAPVLPLTLGILLLAGCGSTPDRKTMAADGNAAGAANFIPAAHGDFAGKPDVTRFILHMERTHGFDRAALASLLAQARHQPWIIEQMDRQAPRADTGPTGAWTRYRARFVTADNLTNGLRFWQRHAAALDRAQAKYGVPPEYVLAIIGVETRYGTYTGKTRILDALATLAFAYPRRADYFAGELEAFLVMTRDEGMDPLAPRGSFAGAMGLGQFMPSSFHRYAVDFDGDGHRDLWNPVDAIGSVANYFKGHGWRANEAVAVPARRRPNVGAVKLKTGFDSRHGLDTLAASGVTPLQATGLPRTVSLIQLDVGTGYEYWLGLNNFYTITRYNHSSYYAMAVHQLAEGLRARRDGPDGARVSRQSEAADESRL